MHRRLGVMPLAVLFFAAAVALAPSARAQFRAAIQGTVTDPAARAPSPVPRGERSRKR